MAGQKRSAKNGGSSLPLGCMKRNEDFEGIEVVVMLLYFCPLERQVVPRSFEALLDWPLFELGRGYGSDLADDEQVAPYWLDLSRL